MARIEPRIESDSSAVALNSEWKEREAHSKWRSHRRIDHLNAERAVRPILWLKEHARSAVASRPSDNESWSDDFQVAIRHGAGHHNVSSHMAIRVEVVLVRWVTHVQLRGIDLRFRLQGR